MKPVFSYDSYKKAIHEILLAKQREVSREFTFQAMAQAARVQKAYVSRVLGGDAHFNEDQLYLCCGFLGLNEPETEYMMLLLQRDRSVVPARCTKLEQRLKMLKAKHLETAATLKSVPEVSGPAVSDEYHLNPFMQIIHMFLMVDKFARDPSKIRSFLALEAADLQYILSSLERMGLVKKTKIGFEVVTSAFHLNPTSPLFKPHLQLLRLRSLDRITRSTSADSYNLSVTFTANRAVRDQLHTKFMEYLREAETLIGPAPSDGVYQMNFDLFSWS